MTQTVLIADDHPLFRAAMRQAVEQIWSDTAIIEVSNVAAARQEIDKQLPLLLLLDLHMEDSDGLSALLDFRQDFPAMAVAVVSASEESRVWQAARNLGAAAFIPKSAELGSMREALAAVREGDIWFPEMDATIDAAENEELLRLASLTPAQRRILNHLTKGLLNKQIAYEMDISEATVKAHITAIFRKLGVVNRTQAVLVAGRLVVEQPVTASQ
ncbi:MAG: response regulator transcription factor [Pseudomonadota bacterium]